MIMEQLAYNTDHQFNALLSDEVVMQWLMDLEAEQAEQAEQTEEALERAH